MSSTSPSLLDEVLWDPTKFATIKEEIISLRYYQRREADPSMCVCCVACRLVLEVDNDVRPGAVGRRIARGPDPRAIKQRISKASIERRYEEIKRSEFGKKLIEEVVAEEEALEAINQKRLEGSSVTEEDKKGDHAGPRSEGTDEEK